MTPRPQPSDSSEIAAERFRLFGTHQPTPSTLMLQAGPLSCCLEEGAVRSLCWSGVEVLRGVSYLLRDGNWGTAPAQVGPCTVQQTPDAFQVHFAMELKLPEGTLHAQAALQGDASGIFEFSVDALAENTLHTNRCGFVVLHPAAAAGVPLEVEHTGGGTELTEFPRYISAGQVAFDIRRLRHMPQPGLVVDCLLQAELPHDPRGKFEMEDQRNWSDGSFKTYVASLLDPWPYALEANVRYAQSVRVRVQDQRKTGHEGVDGRTQHKPLRVGAEIQVRMPAIGVGVPGDLQRLHPLELQCLESLRPAWLVAEIDATQPDALLPQLQALHKLASTCNAKVQLDVVCSGSHEPQVDAHFVADSCALAGLNPDAIRACPAPYLKSYQPNDTWPDIASLEEYAYAYRALFPSASVGGGMLTYFTELNRKRPSADGIDFVAHTTCPLVHAADDLSVMQTVEALPSMVASVRQLWPGLAYRLGPVTLAMHRNPYGASVAENPHRLRVPMAAMDPRHSALFGAAWLAAYAATVAPLGVDVLSFNHSHGSSGPLQSADGHHTRTEHPIPSWHVQTLLARATGSPILEVNNVPQGVQALGWQSERTCLMLVNLTDVPKTVMLEGAWEALQWPATQARAVANGTLTATTIGPYRVAVMVQ